MPLDTMILVAQTVSVFFLAAWLTSGVYENVFYSSLNSTFTAEVLEMKRMAEEYPEAYALVSYRRITNPGLQKWLFRLIVAWELAAVAGLWIGVLALTMAVFGLNEIENARAWGLFGTLMFTTTWAGFLIAGNWFCYWFSHEGGQNTHFQMTLWGFATMILLVSG